MGALAIFGTHAFGFSRNPSEQAAIAVVRTKETTFHVSTGDAPAGSEAVATPERGLTWPMDYTDAAARYG